MKRFRYEYGAGPLHLLSVLACFGVTGFVALRVLDGAVGAPLNFLIWFVAAIAAHDFVLFPLYTGLDRLAGGRRLGGGVNYVRVPVLLSLLLLLIFLPLILTLSPGTYESATGLEPESYLRNWLAVSAVLFLAAGVAYALHARRSAPPGPGPAAGEATHG